MEEELRKRNTDCVYFLASPLTCKKGVECEYRHSDIARHNPRDCWYWLAGNCLNPTCAFRHPPLEGHCEPSPMNKTNIPCYYFFNGFCNKGDTCSFLHDPDGSNSAGKSLKTVSAVNDVPLLENKTFVGSDTGSAPTETHPSSSQNAPKTVMELQHLHNENFQHSAPNNVWGGSPSPQRSSSECDEAAAIKSECSLQAESFIQNRSLESLLFSDQSSEEQVDAHIAPEDQVDGHNEHEERWESSPGFDVLVDDDIDDLGYEVNAEYALALNRDQRELNSHLLHYGFEVPYHSTFPDAGVLYEHGICDSYDHLENEHNPNIVDKLPGRSRERMSNPILCRKRKVLPRELSVNGWSDMDLRDCLRKRRVIDGRPVTHTSRRHISSRQIGRIWERPRRPRKQQLRGRLAPKVENYIIESLSEIEDHPSRAKQRGWFRPSQIYGSRQHVNGKMMSKGRLPSSGISKEPVSRRRKSTQESSSFSGPKTLSQIKDAKKKGREYGDSIGETGHTSRNSSKDFQGPKPLSEILKEKKKLSSAVDGSISSR